jgi:urocanate hydratase
MGDVGIGFSKNSGMVALADGKEDAARRLGRVLWNKTATGTGVVRHAHAGFELAIDCATVRGLKLLGLL